MSTDRQQQLDECIEALYSSFIDPQPHNFYISYSSFQAVAQDVLDVDGREIQDLWALFEDRYVHPRPTKNSDLLNRSALERAS